MLDSVTQVLLELVTLHLSHRALEYLRELHTMFLTHKPGVLPPVPHSVSPFPQRQIM